MNIMDILQHDFMPVGAAGVSFAAYMLYMKQTCPEEEEDYQTAAKLAVGVGILSYLVQQVINKNMAEGGEEVLEGPFIKKE